MSDPRHHDDARALREQLCGDVLATTRRAMVVLETALGGKKFDNDEQRHACTAAFGLAKALVGGGGGRQPPHSGPRLRHITPEQFAETQRKMEILRQRIEASRIAGREMVETFKREGPVEGVYQDAKEAFAYGMKVWEEQHPKFESPVQPEAPEAPEAPDPSPAEMCEEGTSRTTSDSTSENFRKLPVLLQSTGDRKCTQLPQNRRATAIELLLSGKSYRDVAAAVGVSERTLYTWRQDEHFREALRQRREELWSGVAERLRGMVHPSLDILNRQLEDRHDKSRFRAATTVLRLPVLRKILEAAVAEDEG